MHASALRGRPGRLLAAFPTAPRYHHLGYVGIMAYYYSVRGWLEADTEAFEAATALIGRRQSDVTLSERDALYLRGWTWSEVPINWTRYLFYGADVTEAGVDGLRALLSDLCALGGELDGYFRITGEDGEQNLDLDIQDDVMSQVKLAAPSSRN